METEHGPGLFLFAGALAIPVTVWSLRSILLLTAPVLFLCSGSLLAGLVHAVLSVIEALPCPETAPVPFPPKPAANPPKGRG